MGTATAGKTAPFELPDWVAKGPPSALAGLPIKSFRDETSINEIHSAVFAIPASAISAEEDWVRLARGLAHQAACNEGQVEELWEILDQVSSQALGYDQKENQKRWLRYIDEAFRSDKPITIATVFHLAREHGWQGWSPPLAVTAVPSGPAPTPLQVVWSEKDLRLLFTNVPHRRWLYGTYLIRGEVTVLGPWRGRQDGSRHGNGRRDRNWYRDSWRENLWMRSQSPVYQWGGRRGRNNQARLGILPGTCP